MRLLAAQTPAHFVAFDLLALGDTTTPSGRSPSAARRSRRRWRRVRPPVHLTPATMDNEIAEQWFSQFEGAGLDGLIAKPRSDASTSPTSG